MPDNNRVTPLAIARLMMDSLPKEENYSHICDVGSGPTAAWARAAGWVHPHAFITCVDIKDYHVTTEDAWNEFHKCDFLNLDEPTFNRIAYSVDLWVSNPPYPRAELWLHRMRVLSKPTSKIFLFLNNGWIEGKDRRICVFDKFPPNLIVFLDGRIIDRTNPGESGTDNRSRAGFYWDLAHLVEPGETRCKWVGSDNVDDYKVR